MIDPHSTVAWVAREILPHEPALRGWLRRAGIQAAEIDDLIQESYCRLSELASVAHIHNPRAYLFMTARSLLLQRLRREKVVPMHPLSEDFDTPDGRPSVEESVGARLALSRVIRTLRTLPSNYRAVVELRRIEGLSQKETAHRLGLSEKTVENNLARGLAALLKAIKQAEEAGGAQRYSDDMEEARHVAGH